MYLNSKDSLKKKKNEETTLAKKIEGANL